MNADPKAALAAIDSVRRFLGETPVDSLGQREHSSARSIGQAAMPRAWLSEVLCGRRSHYSFAGAPSNTDLVCLLGWACGADWRTGKPRLLAPAAGGHSALDVFVVADGTVERYDRFDGTLETIAHHDPRVLRSAFAQPEFAERADTFVVIAADPRVGAQVYGARHYRTLHVDSGVLAAHCTLVAEALGLASCIVSGFDDDTWHGLLCLKAEQFVTVVMPVGQRQ